MLFVFALFVCVALRSFTLKQSKIFREVCITFLEFSSLSRDILHCFRVTYLQKESDLKAYFADFYFADCQNLGFIFICYMMNQSFHLLFFKFVIHKILQFLNITLQ